VRALSIHGEQPMGFLSHGKPTSFPSALVQTTITNAIRSVKSIELSREYPFVKYFNMLSPLLSP
jgi:hypothetical protein